MSVVNASLVLRGVTSNHKRRMVTEFGATRELQRGESAPWRMCYNGNPRGMLEVVEQLLPDTNVLFIVQRDLNRNVVVYAYDEGRGTVRSFWLIVPANARRSPPTLEEDLTDEEEEVDVGDAYVEELTSLEQTFAYGVTTHADGRVSIKPLEGHILRIQKEGSKWVAFDEVKQKLCVVREVFVCTEPCSWRPWPTTTECHITYAETLASPPFTCHYNVVIK